MKAIRVHTFGGPEVMVPEEVPRPSPGEGQALVRVEAAGVNFIDIYQRLGQYPVPLPMVPGNEGAGVVEQIGPGVREVSPGDRVAYSGSLGAYAEYAVVPSWRLVRLPTGVDTRIGAAAMLQGMTAHYLTHSTFPLKPGDACLVHAAAGGVGLLLLQMAKRRGARTIGTVSTPGKAELARQFGADEVILYTSQDFEAEVKRLTGGRGVQAVYDSVGRDTFDKSLNCLSPRGMLVLYGQSSGPVAPLDPQILSARGGLFLTRPSLSHYTATREELLQRAGDLLGWAASGKLRVRIGGEYPLEMASRAHSDLAGRGTTGKLLLIP
ncbi:MAG TPA: NADPH:quinone reductase [Deltaproteobacteria bacterium]|nr:MAG: NADPH:quinone reductase [Deltaproteobacteria bacterium GWC2_65_14]HBO70319.1 NADPH:quinone reductase [Deltaproteobacteria bacterium]